MKKITLNLKLFLKTTVFAVVSLLMVVYVQAQVWNAPTAFPPGDNTPTPINEGTDAQVKDGTLGVNGLGVFGNSIFNADPSIGTYLNFGTISGATGYGIRDNNGVIECRDDGGVWGACDSGGSGGACTFAGKKPSGWPDAMMCSDTAGHSYTMLYGGEQHTPGVHNYVSVHGTGYVRFDSSGNYIDQLSFGGYDCVGKTITQIQTEGIGFNMCGGAGGGGGVAEIILCNSKLMFYAPSDATADADGCVASGVSGPVCPSGELPAPDTGICGNVLSVYTFKQSSTFGQCGVNFPDMDRCSSLDASDMTYLLSCGYHSFSPRGTCIGGFNCPEDGLSSPNVALGTCNGQTFTADPPSPSTRCVPTGGVQASPNCL